MARCVTRIQGSVFGFRHFYATFNVGMRMSVCGSSERIVMIWRATYRVTIQYAPRSLFSRGSFSFFFWTRYSSLGFVECFQPFGAFSGCMRNVRKHRLETLM